MASSNNLSFKIFKQNNIFIINKMNILTEKANHNLKCILEMKENDIQAIGIYPGGQSGNPGSSNYDNLIDQWKDGEYLDLNFTYYRDKDSLKGKRITFINED